MALLFWKPFSIAAFDLVKGLMASGVQPMLVIDVGANTGQFSRAAREMWGKTVRIVGFEPVGASYAALRQNFKGDGSALFQNCAAGSSATSVEINVNSFSQSSSFFRLSREHIALFPAAREVRREVVEVQRLDTLLRNEKWAVPSLLKIDVQGYELEVLKGATDVLCHVDHVIVEVALVPLYEGQPTFEDVGRELRSAGLMFSRSISTLKNENNGVSVQMDALFSRLP